MKYRYKSFSGWLLVALLLIGQASLLVHESQHEINSTDNFCVICHNPSLNSGGPAAQQISVYLPYVTGTVLMPTAVLSERSVHYTPQAPRAPPHVS